MNFETLNFQQEGQIGILFINRPKAMNALNKQVISELDLFVNRIKEIKNLRALIITGTGEKAFVAGADIKEMETLSSNESQKFSEYGQNVFQKLEDLPIPTIAAVNGFALGGGLELALSCDFIIASKTAKMGLPEVSLGLIPGYGGTQRLSRLCGRGIAKRVALTGDIYSAEQCMQWGLITELTEPADLMSRCMKVAELIAKRSPQAIALAKKSIHQGVDVSQAAGMQIEAKYFAESFGSADKNEGVSAFIEKRSPNFKSIF